MNDKTTEVVFIAPDLGVEDGPVSLESLQDNPRGEPLTWGATPLIHSSEIALQQFEVKNVLSPLFDKENIPFLVSAQMADYVFNLNSARTLNRETKNQISYMCRQKTDLDDIPLEHFDLIDRAAKGHASPAELLYLADVFGIPTIELASLTHPYGQRIEYLEPMRQATDEAIILMGGILGDDAPTYEVKGADSLRFTEDMKALHMTRKRVVGILPNGFEIVERSSFVVALKYLPKETVSAIKEIPYGEKWAELVYDAGQLSEIIPVILKNDEYKKAIPVSTTIVAMHEGLSKELLTEDVRRDRQQRMLGFRATRIPNTYTPL